tara:strand:+ start:19023 stop:19613 length:591 start_codon:yes stop_codon:yes gene_type:complete
MKQKDIDVFYNCLDCGDRKKFEELLKKYLEKTDNKEASEDLAMLFLHEYTLQKADYLAAFLEIIFKAKKELALVNMPENPFFKLSIIRGSTDLFECYMEEGINEFLETLNRKERKKYFDELLKVAAHYNAKFLNEYKVQIKGMHYNGGINHDTDGRLLNIHKEDFEMMQDMVDKYNTIVGRRDIMTLLMKEVGMIS